MDFDSIEEPAKSRIVEAGIEFMSAITSGFGADAGFDIWDKFADSVSPVLKTLIMLEVMQSNAKTIAVIGFMGFRDKMSGQFVPLVKLIRNVTGLGLKEAKDLADTIDGGKDIVLNILNNTSSWSRTDIIKGFRSIGLTAR